MLEALRCWLGLHNPPADQAFTCMGAVFAGGPCTRCPDQTFRERRFLGNAWEFGGDVKEAGDLTVHHVSFSGLVSALKEKGLTYIGDVPA